MQRRSLGIALVAVAAALWGTDALFRRPLAHSTGVSTIVFGEHVVLVLVTLPFLLPSARALLRLGWRYLLAALVIGAGSSAVATILFTQAFVSSANPVTPSCCRRCNRSSRCSRPGSSCGSGRAPASGFYLAGALAGTWLMAFPSPVHHVFADWNATVRPVLFSLGAAVLWALGTVLGRYLTRRLRFEHVTTLRFAFGLPASAIAVWVLGDPFFSSAHDSVWIAILALVTGAIALALYYYGLRSTPAVAATIAELAFPVTAAIVGYAAFGATLDSTQWLGVGVTTAVVTLLPVRSRDVIAPVPAPAPA